MSNSRIIFAGTPEFSAVHLRALIDAGIHPIAVYTQPDRPAGRGQHAQKSAVKILAQAHGIPVEQPPTLKDLTAQSTLQSYAADLMIVVAYGLLLPQAVLDMPKRGCVNVHASLLPRWRGAAPIQRALLAGDAQSGVALMRMEAGLDTGPVFAVRQTDINDRDTSTSLHDRLAQMGAQLLLANIDGLLTDQLSAQPQPTEGISYARKIEKSEAQIDWTQSAQTIDRNIRAFNPFPIAYTFLHDELIKIHQARVCSDGPSFTSKNSVPGCVLAQRDDDLLVQCGEQVLAVEVLQLAGGKRLGVRDLLLSKRERFSVGAQFKMILANGEMS